MNNVNGILPVQKPSAISSHDVIRIFKRSNPELVKTTKIGHAGTLDVFAEGVLLLMLGKATKKFDEIQKLPKTYIAQVRLGASSSTLDIEGEITHQQLEHNPTFQEIESALPQFIKKQQQTVPMFSAAKHNGKPLYEYARKGIKIEERSKEIEVYDLTLQGYTFPLANIEIKCSSGTYIRQLSYDIFHSLNIQSFLYGLKRTSIGSYSFDKACSIEQIKQQSWTEALIAV